MPNSTLLVSRVLGFKANLASFSPKEMAVGVGQRLFGSGLRYRGGRTGRVEVLKSSLCFVRERGVGGHAGGTEAVGP